MISSAAASRTHAAVALLALALSACGGDGDADDAPLPPETFAAELTGEQEAPVQVSTAARGSATFTLDRATNTMSGRVVTSNVTPLVAHIHIGTVGVAGPVSLRFTLDAATGEITLPPTVLTQAQLNDLAAGALYVNVHSEAHPAGEIRGQIGPVAGTAQVSVQPPRQTARNGATARLARWIGTGTGAGALPDDICTTAAPRPPLGI